VPAKADHQGHVRIQIYEDGLYRNQRYRSHACAT